MPTATLFDRRRVTEATARSGWTMTTWQEDFAQGLTGAGMTIEAADFGHATPRGVDGIILGLHVFFWSAIPESSGARDLLNITPQVPAMILSLGWYTHLGDAEELLRKAPDQWPIGHLIETLHTVWDQTKGHRGGLDNMSDAHEAGEAAS